MSMRRQTLRSLATAIAIGFAAGYPGWVPAADTEIYLGSDALRPGARPNVMFIFDTSLSMTALDGGSVSRIERMKDAVRLVLDSVNNINAGLMRFTEPGGPVLFPVTYIEDSADGQPDVNVRIRSFPNDPLFPDPPNTARDDAEQLGTVVRLDSPVLELLETPVSGPETTVSMLPVTNPFDDAEHGDFLYGGFSFPLDFLSQNMEATDDLGTSVFFNRVNGVIFRNLGIPPNQNISSSYIEFRSNSSRAGDVTLTFRGEAAVNPPQFGFFGVPPFFFGPRASCQIPPIPFGCFFVPPALRRTLVPGSVDWRPSLLTPDEFHRTPDLSAIAQQIVAQPGWNTNGDMAFVFSGTRATDPSGRRDFTTFDTLGNPSRAARLSVTYGAGPGGTQQVGLRFRDVRVPQGMRIINAVIEFVPTAQSTGTKDVNVYGELAVDSAPFTATANNISNRTRTAPVPWTMPAWPTVDEPQQTTNLRAIVQEIVNQQSWCGGNAMTFIIDDPGAGAARKAFSYESDPERSPVLRIDFDEDTPLGAGQGCTVIEVQRQVSASADDAFQFNTTGGVFLTGPSNFARAGFTSGWRFTDLTLIRNAFIIDARLFLTAANPDTGTVSTTIRAHLSADAGGFTTSINDLTARATGVGVPWSPPGMVTNVEYSSPNIATVIAEVVSQNGWASGNDLVLLMSTTGANFRRFQTFDLDPSRAARLYVKARVNVGDGAAPAVTVRQRIKDLVAELPAINDTPLVDALYEAALYFRSDPVDYGRNRGTREDAVKRKNRISHKDSFTGGRILPADTICSPSNLNATSCIPQNIASDAGATPTYVSPISETCQANFIVLLTDGEANVNNSQTKILNMTGDNSCSSTLLDGTTPIAPEAQCGLELAEFLATEDQDSSTPDDVETVKTYTIGFNIQSGWLEDLADAGDGEYFTANSAAELAATLRDIIAAILSRTTSFAQPSLSVNAFNRLFHRNEVYFSLFAPSERVRWAGNVKKYQLCQTAADGCEVGEVLDFQEAAPGDLTRGGKRAGNPAIGTGQRISSNAKSDWLPGNDAADGAEVLVGGAGRVLQEDVGANGRRVFTYLGGPTPALLQIGSSNEIRANTITDVTLLGGSTVSTSPDFMPEAERLALIDWIRGLDVDDEDRDGNRTETRYLFGDPLHSSPVAITFGTEYPDNPDASPVIKVFVGTNDGSVRMLNSRTGEEEWAFIPPSLLRNQRVLRDNPRAEHVYGMDGTPTLWVNDEDGDGIIDPSVDVDGDGVFEFVRMFIGMRRGGAEIVALDVTPTAVLDDPVSDTIDPRLMWIITGNRGGTTLTPLEYGRLGDTWSRPRITTVREAVPDVNSPSGFISVRRPVLIFAGGYDNASQDGPTGLTAGGVGNAIYIVDPVTGGRLAFVTGDASPTSVDPDDDIAAHTNPANGIPVPGMEYPIPSDVALLDSDGDGATDRLYVGDTGGQLWRVDIDADTNNGGIKLVVGQLASVSTPPPGKKNSRKFFYPPDVVQVRDRNSHSANGNYDLVTIVTGNRSHPLDLDVQDRFYAIYDETIGRMNDIALPVGLADGYPVARDGSGGPETTGIPIAGPTDADGATLPLAGDLLRINDRINFDATTTEGATNLSDLASRSGYYLDFGPPNIPGEDPPSDSGEKGLAPPIVLAGKVFFTTYLPRAVVSGSVCSLSEGGGRLYGLDVLTGAPAYNYDESADPDNLTVGDRVYTLGGGIPSAAVPIFQPEAITLLIGGGGGATTVNPNVALPRERTYWLQQ